MVDFLGNTLSKGDRVIYLDSKNLCFRIGYVHSMTDKSVNVVHYKYCEEKPINECVFKTRRNSKQVLKYEID